METTEQLLSKRGKGGFWTMPFIIMNESFEKVSSYGLTANIIIYMMVDYHMGLADGTTALSLWMALSSALAVLGAFLSDSYLGRFKVIAIGSFSSLLGMLILWLTTVIPQLKPPPCIPNSSSCLSATPSQLTFFFFSWFLISLGAGCIRPCSMAFGADQLHSEDNPNNKRLLQSFFNWYYASIGLSVILALTVILYIQQQWGWKLGFGIPTILMLLSVLAFLLGSPLYVKREVEKDLFSGFFQVPVAAFRNKALPFPAQTSHYHHGHNSDSNLTAPTPKLRWLNKACIIRDPKEDLKPDGSATNPWRLCTIEQVEMLKVVLRVIPIWSTGFLILISMNQQGLATIQANSMDRRISSKFQIPAGSLYAFVVIAATVYVVAYDRLLVPALKKYTRHRHGLSTKVRMGSGLVLSIVATTLCAVLEGVRRRLALDQGLADRPGTVTNMSALWLIPQYSLFGLAEAMNAVAQIEFIYAQFPKSVSSVGMALYGLGGTVASFLGALLVRVVDGATKKGGKVSWLSDNINKGHLDYFYWLLTAMGVLNFVYFLICCSAFGPMDATSRVHAAAVDTEEKAN